MNEPDLTVILPVGFYLYNYAHLFKPTTYNEFLAVGDLNLAGHINNISFLEPSSPLLTEPGKAIVCDGNHKPEECKGQEASILLQGFYAISWLSHFIEEISN